MEQLLSKILEKIKKTPDIQVFRDLYYMCLECMKTDVKLATRYLVALSDECERAIATAETETYIKDIFSLHKRVLLAAAPEHFESYLLYVEWMREPEKKFYPPRRKVLKQVVDALQELEDDKLDLLAISLPPGSGKTTLAIFYLTWIAGKHADEPSLTGSHSNAFVRGVYDECLRILDPQGEYLWHDVFPLVNVSNTNAKDCRIDIGKRMFNTVNKDIYTEFSNATLEVTATAFNFDAFVDAAAKLNLENLDGVTIFGFVCPDDMAKVRKALKDDLKYVEAFAKNGYVGTVAGINLYTKKDATAGTIIIATKEAVTLFNKKGVEVEQVTQNNRSETAANIRQSSIFTRKYYIAALTDATKAVKITVGE